MSEQQSGDLPSNPPSPVRVLVVEDDAMVGEVVCAMLQMGGYGSVHAHSGARALELLDDPGQRFDLLLTDFLMPGLNGIELIQKARPLRPEMKVILYSGNVDERQTLNYPVRPDRFLRKPFTPTTLNEVVRSVVGR